MRPWPELVLHGLAPALASLLLVGCDAQSPAPSSAGGRQDEAAYLRPPSVDVVFLKAGYLEIGGRAVPESRVRLTRPDGVALAGAADPTGRWLIRVPGAGGPQVFGLSQTIQGRTIQADGYIFHSPAAGGWRLRAGAAAQPLGDLARQALVVDYDRRGGAVISGKAPGEGLLVVQIDGRRAGEGRVGAAGRYEIRLSGPAPMGESRLRVFGEGLNREIVMRLSPPGLPIDGPVKAIQQGAGLRIDWITPGGGVQTTQILS